MKQFQKSYKTIEEFMKDVNSVRKVSKGKWYTFVGTVQNKKVRLKAFSKWPQVLDVDGIRHGHSGGFDTVAAFKSYLSEAIAY